MQTRIQFSTRPRGGEEEEKEGGDGGGRKKKVVIKTHAPKRSKRQTTLKGLRKSPSPSPRKVVEVGRVLDDDILDHRSWEDGEEEEEEDCEDLTRIVRADRLVQPHNDPLISHILDVFQDELFAK